MENTILEKFHHLLETYKIKTQVDLKNYTSFQISSIAKYFVDVHEAEDIIKAIAFARENNLEYFLLGNGSNVLFKDAYYEGIIIHIGEHFSKVTLDKAMIKAQAGALLADVSKFALENSLCGLEFACGIPGSVGGAVFMNAGAYDGEMKDVVKKVQFIDRGLQIRSVDCRPDDFEYRNSFIQKEASIVLCVVMELQGGDSSKIKEKMDDFTFKRTSKQPLEYPSAGSAFKRPQGFFAGKLIEECGLKGFCVGDACVSEKHCGFIINKGDATAQDVMDLVSHIQKTVYEKFGVAMEREFKII